MEQYIVAALGILGSYALKDYAKHSFFPRDAKRLVWIRVKKVLPRQIRRETYRSFNDVYRREKSSIKKLRIITSTIIHMKDHDIPESSCAKHNIKNKERL